MTAVGQARLEGEAAPGAQNPAAMSQEREQEGAPERLRLGYRVQDEPGSEAGWKGVEEMHGQV